MLVWRIENSEDRIGPYNSQGKKYSTREGERLRSSVYNLGRDPYDIFERVSHKTPDEDGIGWISQGEFCGFKTLQQLTEWFPKEIITRLYAFDFSIVTYDVPMEDIRIGLNQLVFYRDDHEETRKVRGLDVLSRIR